MDITDLFDPSVPAETQVKMANVASAALVSQQSAAGKASLDAMQQAQQQQQLVAKEKQDKEQAAYRHAQDITSMFDTDELNGLLAGSYAESVKKSTELRKQYDELSQTSFLDNPIMWIFNQFSKDQIAEQVNNIESIADNSRDHMRTIALQKDAAFKTAENASKIMSDKAQAAQLESTRLASEAAIADKQVALAGNNLQGIAHLQQGALHEIQMERSAEQIALERERMAMSRAEHAANEEVRQLQITKLKADIADIPVEAAKKAQELSNLQTEGAIKQLAYNQAADSDSIKNQKEAATLEHLKLTNEFMRETDPLKKRQMEANLAILTNKVGDLTGAYSKAKAAEDELVAGANILGYNVQGLSIKDIKRILGNNIQLAQAAGRGGKLGPTAGEAIVNWAKGSGITPPEDLKEGLNLLGTYYGKAMEVPEIAKAAGQVQETLVANYVNTEVKKLMGHAAVNAEMPGSIIKPSAISAVLTADNKLATDPKILAVLQPLMEDTSTNMLTDSKSIMGRVSAAIKEGKISSSDVGHVISSFYSSGLRNTYLFGGLQKLGIDIPKDMGYTVMIDGDKYDLTKPAEAQRAWLASSVISQMMPRAWDLPQLIGKPARDVRLVER